MDSSTSGFPVLHHLSEFAQTHVHGVGDAIQPSHPLSSPSLAFNLIRVFSKESVLCIRWPKYWSFSFSISPSNEYSGLISFRIDWFDLLAVQGTLKSLLQHHSSKVPILWCPAFFMVQLSHPQMTTGKTITLTIWDFVSKIYLFTFLYQRHYLLKKQLFNMSRLVIAFLPRSKNRLISWLKSPICSDFGAPQNKSLTLFPLFLHLFPMKWGPDAMILVSWMLSLSQLFHSPLSLSSRGSLVLLYFLS